MPLYLEGHRCHFIKKDGYGKKGVAVALLARVCSRDWLLESWSGRQRSVKGNSIADYLVYFGVELMGGGDFVGSCIIVADPHLMKYGGPDTEGNILSQTPVASAVRLRVGYTKRDQII